MDVLMELSSVIESLLKNHIRFSSLLILNLEKMYLINPLETHPMRYHCYVRLDRGLLLKEVNNQINM
jgi:hypothetical protein